MGADQHQTARAGAPAGMARKRAQSGHHAPKPPIKGEECGYDAVKKVKGRKRHIAVDALGLLLVVVVHATNTQERDGTKYVFWLLRQQFTERLVKVIADGGAPGSRWSGSRHSASLCWKLSAVRKKPRGSWWCANAGVWCGERAELAGQIPAPVQGLRVFAPEQRKHGVSGDDQRHAAPPPAGGIGVRGLPVHALTG